MQETIIEKVGQIYNYLSERGEVTTTKMRKDLSLDEAFAGMGIGWLAREDKINLVKRGAHTKISLR
ncbi:winged helix-turn-helix domain-containing protein [bacterium]|nr:winged helix-turn-helix domain-containing protein [bacterium]MBR1976676.1 winged helix-turn-helix domain-containing protein [bacterium]